MSAGAAPLPPSAMAPPSPAPSVRLKPVYYRRAGEAEGDTVSDVQLRHPERQNRLSSGVLMVRRDSHHHIEGNIERIRDLARQRNGLLYCALAFLVALTILVTTWGVLKHYPFK